MDKMACTFGERMRFDLTLQLELVLCVLLRSQGLHSPTR